MSDYTWPGPDEGSDWSKPRYGGMPSDIDDGKYYTYEEAAKIMEEEDKENEDT